MKHIVNVSGGEASAVALFRVVEKFGRDNVVASFADTYAEDAGTYDFLAQVERAAGVPIVRLSNGQSTWQLFESRGMWTFPGTGGCVASHYLKKLALQRHSEAIATPETCVIYVGFDASEQDRIERLNERGKPWRYDYPLTWSPKLLRCDVRDDIARRGLKPSDLYDQGFPHSNCSGACVLAGIGQWRALLDKYPERYAAAEAHEKRMMEAMEAAGRTVQTILRDRRGGVTRSLSLRQLREEHDSGKRLPDSRWGESACSCVGDLFAEYRPEDLRAREVPT